jgi:flagellar motor switch protein FliN/FliY
VNTRNFRPGPCRAFFPGDQWGTASSTIDRAVVKHHRLEFTPVKREAPLSTLDNVSIDISVALGRTAMPIHQVLRLGRGAIIELDSSEEDEVRILANNMPVARGMVIVSGDRIAVEVKELLPRSPEVV